VSTGDFGPLPGLEVAVPKGNHHTTRGLVHRSGPGLKFKLGQRLR
jgi:hypothetical protein